jgi:putative Mg2+ transporter-C (MgtC) family protein
MDLSLSTILTQIYPVYKILLAIVLGGMMGYQREISGKSAGLRTYALVCAGSALFTHLSITAFSADTARVAAQIITGIGFLGAGIIMHKKDGVVGLTTAAGLWITSAVGMAVGVDMYLLAIIIAILILIVLMIDDKQMLHGTIDKNNQANRKFKNSPQIQSKIN